MLKCNGDIFKKGKGTITSRDGNRITVEEITEWC